MIIDSKGYLARRSAGKGRAGRSRSGTVFQNWFAVRAKDRKGGVIPLGQASFPESMLGKKVRFKLEVIDE